MRPVTLFGLVLLGACSGTSPELSQSEPEGYRTVNIDYDDARLRVSATSPLTDEESSIVLSVGRVATARYIEARSSEGVPPVDGRFRGPLSLHRGWRQEFFPLAKELYEATRRLQPGVLHVDPSPFGVTRDVGKGWVIRGRSDHFSAFFNTVIEVPDPAVYAFGMNTDDGSIGTLQNLEQDMEELHVLWYEWAPRGMAPSPTEVRVLLEPGTYLLTVHYFEEGGLASYLVYSSREPDGDSTAIPLGGSEEGSLPPSAGRRP